MNAIQLKTKQPNWNCIDEYAEKNYFHSTYSITTPAAVIQARLPLYRWERIMKLLSKMQRYMNYV